MNDVFICYAPEDESLASDICNLLESNSYKCWYKKRDHGENDSVIKITEAVRDSRSLLLIHSKDAQKSNFVTTEVDIAFSSNVAIGVFNADDTPIEGKLHFYLKDKPTVNAYPNPQDHYDELLKVADEYLGEGSTDSVKVKSDENEAYICYADEDVLTAEAIAHVLEENGIKCWFKKRDLKASETIQKVSETIKKSKSFILVYSDSASKSNFVKTDTDLAITSNIPILPYKIDDIEESDKLSDAHWLDAYPNPEDNFKELVTSVGNMIGKPVDNPKITKSYKNLRKVEKTDKKNKTAKKSKDTPSKNVSNKENGKNIKIIAVAAVILAILAGAGYYLTSTTTDIASTVNIPAGFQENTEYGYSEHDATGSTDYKFYEAGDLYFDVLVIHGNSGAGLADGPEKVDKTINGVPGKYISNSTSFEFMDSKGNLVIVSASSEDLLNQIIK